MCIIVAMYGTAQHPLNLLLGEAMNMAHIVIIVIFPVHTGTLWKLLIVFVQSARAKLGARRDKNNRQQGLTEEQKQEIRCVAFLLGTTGPSDSCILALLMSKPGQRTRL